MRVLVTGGSGFIGSRFLEDNPDMELCSVDRRDPARRIPGVKYFNLDIRNRSALKSCVNQYEPTHVLHLAARTDTDSNRVEDYSDNVDGTESLLRTLESSSVTRLVLTSTQYVHSTETLPDDDTDFSPFTAYGQSKVINELQMRECAKRGSFGWVIARPTNVWGPRHPRYPHEVWRVMRRGLYLHPALPRSPKRAYGYVGNVAAQMRLLLTVDDSRTERVYYVGDPLINLDEWVDAFHIQLRGHPAPRVPLTLLRTIAITGDLLEKASINAPLTSSRLHNMTADSAAPMEPIAGLVGDAPRTSLQAGVLETVDWLRRTNQPRGRP